MPKLQLDVAVPAGIAQEKQKADELADDGRQGRAADPHPAGEDEQGVEKDVKKTAHPDSDHRVIGASLKAQEMAKYKSRDHAGCTDQKIAQIIGGIGCNGIGGSQGVDQGLEVDQAQQCQQNPQAESGEETGSGHLFSISSVLPAQETSDIITRPRPEGEPDSLDDCHEREGDSHGARSAGADAADKEGVRHVVY